MKDLFNGASNDNQRVQWLSERLVKEIQEEYKNQIELVSLKANLEKATEEYETLKKDIGQERSFRHKLEGVSQDLQRQNKQIIEDSHVFAEEEKKQRMELSQYFQTAIGEISQKLEDSERERLAHVQFNEHLKEKMKELIEQVEQNDNYYKKILDETSAELDTKKTELEAPPTEEEAKMREELEEYKGKFEEFQSSLLGSNNSFVEFKKDMDSKSKAFKRLQKLNFDLNKKITDSKQVIESLKKEREELDRNAEATRQALQKLNELKAKLSG